MTRSKAGFAQVVILGFFALLLVGLTALTYNLLQNRTITHASQLTHIPANNKAKGLVYDGLEIPTDTECSPGTYKIHGSKKDDGTAFCTHGPDPLPSNWNINQIPTTKPDKTDPLPQPVLGASVVCDGDGVTGKRIQVLYVHPSDVADNFATYQSTLQGYSAAADDIFFQSAAQTGGSRHLRFITDSGCSPVITDVGIPDLAANADLGRLFNSLMSMGYNRSDRDYLVFMDDDLYCGIATIEGDDSSLSSNRSNIGPHIARVDKGCWSGVIAAHEVAHNLGAVQMSAPHSDMTYHCTDGYDDMCDHGGSPNLTFTSCPDPIGDSRMDCNHDDYFSTTASAGSYLATHWNVANNNFLIGSANPIWIDSIVTGTLTTAKGKGGTTTFSPLNSFKAGSTMTARAHLSTLSGVSISGGSISETIKNPNGLAVCSGSGLTNSLGNFDFSCDIARQAVKGVWNVHINSVSASGYALDPSTQLNAGFTVY